MLRPIFVAGEHRSGATCLPGQPAGPGLLCDRDGTIIQDRPDYVRSPADVAFLPGAIDALRQACVHGFTIVILSNQSGIGRGLLSLAQTVTVHEYVVSELASQSVMIAGSYLCPHVSADLCVCRKPAPAMLHAAIEDFALDRKRTVFVGDAYRDMAAAEAAGIQGVLMRTGHGMLNADWPVDRTLPGDVMITADLSEAVIIAARFAARELPST